MKTYSIEWGGIVTRDIGWTEVRANSVDEAREKYLREHGQWRRVRAISEVKPDAPR